MDNNEVQTKKKFDFANYGLVVGFLCLEVLAFVSFYLGHSFILYGILSIVLAALLLLVTFRQIKKDGISSFAFFLFPLFVFGLLTALSGFNYSSVGAIGIAESVFVPIALTLFGLCGFLSAYIDKFKIKTALLVIYSALAVFVFINLLIIMIYYVPFYTLIYKNSYIFYEGKPSAEPIGSMAYMLFGFQIKEVSIEYWTLFPSLLLTAVIPLFFIKYKENKKMFLIYLGMSALAFISLLFTISKLTLITDFILVVGIAMIILVAKCKQTRSIFDWMMIVLGALLLLFIIILFITAQTSWGFTSGIRKAISGNALMNRLFISNRYSSSVLVIFQDLFTSFKLFGCPVGGYAYQYDNGVAQVLSGIWLFDNLMSSGLFGAVFFLAAIVIGVRRLFKYVSLGEDKDEDKYLLVSYVLVFLFLSLVLLDPEPLINSAKLSPMFTSAPLLVTLFLLGYSFNKTIKESENKEAPIEKQEESEDEIINL